MTQLIRTIPAIALSTQGMVALLTLMWSTIAQAESAIQENGETRTGYLIQIQLPITPRTATSVEQTLKRLVEESKNVVRAEERPVVVLEFDTSNFRTGRGSQMESCLSLARLLTSAELNRLKTVAFIPASRNSNTDEPEETEAPTSQLMGHAVLVALAAEELVVAESAAIGNASADEKSLDNLVREIYRSIAEKRLTLPVPIVMSMVDPALEILQVSTDNGTVFVDGVEHDKMVAERTANHSSTLAAKGETALFNGAELERLNLLRDQANSRGELERRYKLAKNALAGDPTLGDDWNAVQVSMPGYVDGELVDWTLRAIEGNIGSSESNLFIFRFDSKDGDAESCIKLARRLAELDTNKIRTVAYIEDQASGPAAIVALACDQVIMKESALIGGPFETEFDEAQLGDLKGAIKPIAEAKQVSTALMSAMIAPEMEVMRFREIDSGEIRLLTLDEQIAMPDAGNWKLLGPIQTLQGIQTREADNLGITRLVVSDFDEIRTFYQLDSEPVPLQPTAADVWLREFAAFLTSPFVAPWLLFGAVFFLSTEMSAPGVGVPGFLGTVCFVLFFWSQALGGNAHWLEILLFATGVIFILLELLFLPGVGVFGIGGFLMVVASIVLASQTFVIPMNSDQFNQMSMSLLTLAGAGMGLVVAAIVLRNVFPHAPFLKRIMLLPPEKTATGLDQPDPEATVQWAHLIGRQGISFTNLAPAGKAKIGGQLYDVITDGRLIEKDSKITVDEVSGNRIVVSEIIS